ncbi:MAG: hypothetical protein J4O09_15730, partial [Chloroflexi bacterium]|nr:hypothetical protein [Chloroflexota bacterium]
MMGTRPATRLDRPCPKLVILILPQKEKDLPRVAHLGETLRQAQGDTLRTLLRQSELNRILDGINALTWRETR